MSPEKTVPITIQVSEVVDGKRVTHPVTMQIPESLDRSLKDPKQQELWCRCGYEGGGDIFKDDGECSCGVRKHHYHCPKCGKITQIG